MGKEGEKRKESYSQKDEGLRTKKKTEYGGKWARSSRDEEQPRKKHATRVWYALWEQSESRNWKNEECETVDMEEEERISTTAEQRKVF